MHVFVTGVATELGREVSRQLIDGGHQVTGMIGRRSQAAAVESAGGQPLVVDPASAVEIERALAIAEADLILNLAPQKSNTLLHDGQGWRGLDEALPRQTAALLQAANASRVQFLLHGSYAFLYGSKAEGDGDLVDETAPLRRRGLATALKCQVIERAQRLGAQRIVTYNEENNPMFQLNLQLGFQPQPADIDWEKKPLHA